MLGEQILLRTRRAFTKQCLPSIHQAHKKWPMGHAQKMLDGCSADIAAAIRIGRFEELALRLRPRPSTLNTGSEN